ncbi:hypothetical protein CMI40_02385 [Candidatus Pacearchaeota archaeon]|jgi:hypothetical protein|nr:hypothetical protein [Candidatus Pacearchaeota archaeon]|tara:strand:+ start:7633 stop:8019 length:387 start_codon:yes stop_codon:yes gene_type:complete
MKTELIRTGEIYHQTYVHVCGFGSGWYNLFNFKNNCAKLDNEWKMEIVNDDGEYKIKHKSGHVDVSRGGCIYSVGFSKTKRSKQTPFDKGVLDLTFKKWNELGKPNALELAIERKERTIVVRYGKNKN